MRGPFQVGERVLLIDHRERRYLITLASGGEFHSHRGIVSHASLIGEPEGVVVRSSQGTTFVAFRPTLSDFVLKMKRGAQVVYPKDMAAIILYGDIFPGAKVLEAGSGSGSLTLALARAVGPEGRVISYEVREDHHIQAVDNVQRWYEGSGGKPENLEMRLGDVFEGLHETIVDRMVLDLPEPWRAVGTVTGSLGPGGILCCYLPTVPQVMQLVEAMKGGLFGFISTFEVLLRTWNVDGQSVRPDHRMVAHTGFIVTGRKMTTSQDSPR
ncbi:MAG: tRNA (adenine-N1)-methyltransferase [Actinomycetota bacterium]